MREADGLIKMTFPVQNTERDRDGDKLECVLDRAYCDSPNTYFEVPKELPWRHDGVQSGSHDEKVSRPRLGVVNASAAWLSTLAERFGGEVENSDDGDEMQTEVPVATGLEQADVWVNPWARRFSTG